MNMAKLHEVTVNVRVGTRHPVTIDLPMGARGQSILLLRRVTIEPSTRPGRNEDNPSR